MPISPWYQNQTSPALALTLTDDSGAAINLTGATLSLLIHNTQSGIEVAGAGSWSITNTTAGQATYAWSATDAETVGSYLLFIKIAYSGGLVAFADPLTWQVFPT